MVPRPGGGRPAVESSPDADDRPEGSPVSADRRTSGDVAGIGLDRHLHPVRPCASWSRCSAATNQAEVHPPNAPGRADPPVEGA